MSRLRPFGLGGKRGLVHPHTLVGPAFKAAHAKSIIRCVCFVGVRGGEVPENGEVGVSLATEGHCGGAKCLSSAAPPAAHAAPPFRCEQHRSSLEACAKQLERRVQSIERYIDAPPEPRPHPPPRPSAPPPAPPSSANSTILGNTRQARRPVVKVTLKPRTKAADTQGKGGARHTREPVRKHSAVSEYLCWWDDLHGKYTEIVSRWYRGHARTAPSWYIDFN